jgi:histidinol dehydrogenase
MVDPAGDPGADPARDPGADPGADPARDLLDLVRNAGAVFVGPWSPASLGDYMAGPNHVLPTNRTARFSSALRADDFRRHIHAVTVSPAALEALGPPVITLARTEGLPAHADSVRRRLDALAATAATDTHTATPAATARDAR